MKDMKLVELMPVGKIEPRKQLKETVDVTWGDDGVYIGIDDYSDVVFVPAPGSGFDVPALGKVLEDLIKTRWFVKLVVKIAKTTHVGSDNAKRVKVDFSDGGIKFNWR